MMISQSILILSSLLAAPIYGWGNQGHQLTGGLAQRLISPATRSIVSDLLDQGSDLADAATWADKVKFTKEFAFTRTLHYVDSKDNPPSDCSFDQERDCPGGKCITGAIANYTSRLSCRYSKRDRGVALKFVMHFLGDLTQPLHTCERERGGNDVKVVFDGKGSFEPTPNARGGGTSGTEKVEKKTTLNLHGVWDYNILEKRMKVAYGNSQASMLDHLLTVAKQSASSDEAREWTACLRAPKTTPLDCAISWVRDTNPINCEVVWKLFDANPHQDLGGKYYDAAWPIVERQIIKAGVRAAAWFDANLRDCRGEEAAPREE